MRRNRIRARTAEAADLIDGRLRVGVQLPEVERDVRWPELRAIAQTAEASGYDSIWVGDHMLYRGDARPERGPWDAWSMLAALAASTERVQLGPLVASTAFHPPGLVARMAAAIDEVSAGRFTLGVGTGWNEAEFRAFGIAFENKVARFEEAFTIIRRLLAGERVSFDGRFYRVDDALLLPRPKRRVPLLVGSSGPRVLAATAPHVDWWNSWYSWYGNTPSGFAALSSRFEGDFKTERLRARIGRRRDRRASSRRRIATRRVTRTAQPPERTHRRRSRRGDPRARSDQRALCRRGSRRAWARSASAR